MQNETINLRVYIILDLELDEAMNLRASEKHKGTIKTLWPEKLSKRLQCDRVVTNVVEEMCQAVVLGTNWPEGRRL